MNKNNDRGLSNLKPSTHIVFFQGMSYVVHFGKKHKKKKVDNLVNIRPTKTGLF